MEIKISGKLGQTNTSPAGSEQTLSSGPTVFPKRRSHKDIQAALLQSVYRCLQEPARCKLKPTGPTWKRNSLLAS